MDRFEQLVPERVKTLSGRVLYGVLFGILGAFVGISVIFAALLTVKHVKDGSSTNDPYSAAQKGRDWKHPGLCTDSSCLHTSAWMAENMDTSVDPCDNFYKYSCGGWINKNTIPPDWYSYTVNSKLWHQTDEKLREILTSRIKDRSQGSTERKVKQFFHTCVHDFGRMKHAGKLMADIIKNDLGGWYALDSENWQGSQWDANAALTKAISKYLINTLFLIDTNRRDSKNLITLRYGGIGMYVDDFHDEDMLHVQKAYKDNIRDVGKLLIRDANGTLNNDALEQFVNDAYYIESKIAKHVLELQEADSFYQSPITTIRELNANYTQLNWLQIIRAYFGPGINSDTEVLLRTKPYFDMIDQLLRNETQNKNRIMNNYLIWSFADTYGHYLSWEYKYAKFKFHKVRFDVTEGASTVRNCMWLVEYHLALALGSQFVSKHVDNETFTKVGGLFKDIKRAYNKMIDGFTWMDNVTMTNSKVINSKLEAMIGFPKRFFDKSFIDELHTDLVINASQSFFANILNVIKFYKKTLQMELNSGSHFYRWHFILHRGAFDVRPYYFWETYNIAIPAGAMQFPLFMKNQPLFADYGALGVEVGSEVYRGIRAFGYYEPNRYRWTNNTINRYKEIRSCFRNFTANIELGPYIVNGQSKTTTVKPYTQVQIFPDLVALKAAFDMYQNYQMLNGPEKFPPGVNLTSNQALFLSMAQSHCAKRRDEDVYNSIEGGYFLPEEVRVNMVVSQMKEFSDAFQCKAGSKMNPNDKCLLI